MNFALFFLVFFAKYKLSKEYETSETVDKESLELGVFLEKQSPRDKNGDKEMIFLEDIKKVK